MPPAALTGGADPLLEAGHGGRTGGPAPAPPSFHLPNRLPGNLGHPCSWPVCASCSSRFWFQGEDFLALELPAPPVPPLPSPPHPPPHVPESPSPSLSDLVLWAHLAPVIAPSSPTTPRRPGAPVSLRKQTGFSPPHTLLRTLVKLRPKACANCPQSPIPREQTQDGNPGLPLQTRGRAHGTADSRAQDSPFS